MREHLAQGNETWRLHHQYKPVRSYKWEFHTAASIPIIAPVKHATATTTTGKKIQCGVKEGNKSEELICTYMMCLVDFHGEQGTPLCVG